MTSIHSMHCCYNNNNFIHNNNYQSAFICTPHYRNSDDIMHAYKFMWQLQGKLEEEENLMCPQPKRLKVEERSITPIRRITERKQEPPLPRPFPLPRNFTPSITLALESEKLTGKERAKFMTAIAHSIFTYKSYPTKAELEHVAQEMMKRWKFLAALGTVSKSFPI